MNTPVGKRDLRIGCGREIARYPIRARKEGGHRVGVGSYDDLVPEPIVLAENLFRLHLQQIHLRRGRRRHGDAVGRPEIRDRPHVRLIGQKHQRQRGDTGHGNNLPRRPTRLLPRHEQRRGSERPHVDGAGADRVLQRARAEEPLIARLQVKMNRLAVLLDQLEVLTQIDGQKREPEADADPHRLLCRRRHQRGGQRKKPRLGCAARCSGAARPNLPAGVSAGFLVGNRIAQHADALDFDLANVAVFHPDRRLAGEADA